MRIWDNETRRTNSAKKFRRMTITLDKLDLASIGAWSRLPTGKSACSSDENTHDRRDRAVAALLRRGRKGISMN